MYSDRDLVIAALRNSRAFRAIVERYEEPLRRYIRRLGCNDPQDIEDVLQELFLKCYINLNDYDSSLKFSSWIYRIAHNETMSFFRRKSVRPSAVASEEELTVFENLHDGTDLFEARAQEWDARQLRDVLGKIVDKYRIPLILKYFEDKSYTEISDILQIPEGTVATNINRGKSQLKQLLAENGTRSP